MALEKSIMNGNKNDVVCVSTTTNELSLTSPIQSQPPPVKVKNPEVCQSTRNNDVNYIEPTIATTYIRDTISEPSEAPEKDINDISFALHKSALDDSANISQNIAGDREENRSKQLWKKANMLHQVGYESGLLDDKIEIAASAFDDAGKAMEDLLSITDSNNQSRIKYINFLIQIHIDSTRFQSQIGKYNEAQKIMLKAKDLHQKTWNCKNKKHWKQNSDATLVLVDINQHYSIACYNLGNKTSLQSHCRESIITLRELQKYKSTNNEKLNELLSLTLALSVIDEKNVSSSLSYASEATRIIKTLASKYPSNENYRHRMSRIYRLSNFAFRDANQFQDAEKYLCDAIEIELELLRKHPNSLLYLYEISYCYSAYVSYLKAINEKGDHDNAILTALINQVSAANQVLKRIPSDTELWNSLSCAYLEISPLQERQGNKDASLSTLDQALESATQCVSAKNHPDIFFHYYDLVRVLTDRGRLLNLMSRYEEAIESYARAEEVYRHNIWKHPKANDEVDFYRKVFNSSMLAAHDVANRMNDNDRAYSFLKSSIDIGCGMQTRVGIISLSTNMISFGKLNIESHQYQTAIDVFSEALSMTKTEFCQNPWHYYIGVNYANALLGLANAYQCSKNILLETQSRCEYLEYQADLHGKSDIRGSQHDSLIQLRRECTDVPKTNRYTLNSCSKSIYILSAIPGKDPLEDQNRALAEDYDIIIPDDVRHSFRELQRLALTNNVNFQQLCEYAFSNT